MSEPKRPKILDCTIRDGGYLNDWRFEPQAVREVYRSASHAGIDIVEIGFRGSEEHFDPAKFGPWRFTPDEGIREVTRGIQGAEIAVMGDFGKISPDDFGPAEESPVSLVRIAAHKNKVYDAIDLLPRIREKGYKVALNAMGIVGYETNEILALADRVGSAEMDYFYLADSYGSIFPNQIPELFAPFLTIPNLEVGFHPHNNLQMAFANTLAAIEAGVQIVDSTMFGMGRGAGNLPTEILLSYMQKLHPDRFNPIPILNCIDLYFLRYLKDHPWGYLLHYMISGMLECHPNYAMNLMDRRRYTIEEIWKVLEAIKKRNLVGYKPELIDELIESGFVHGGAEPIAEEGVDRTTDTPPVVLVDQEVPYRNRHEGRPFLVLANGPTLLEYQSEIRRLIDEIDPVVLGANYLADLFIPDYHVFTSIKRFKKYSQTVRPESRLLVSQYIEPTVVQEYAGREYEPLYFVDVLDADFDIDERGVIQNNGRTVSVLLLGLAHVMGASRILAAGLDGYVGTDDGGQLLFYEEEDEMTDRALIVQTHGWCERHIQGIDRYLKDCGGEGVHIVTPTSYKGFFKGIETFV
ncbi:hypothetical protein ACGF5M_02850 [Gemmatimonadota bacterium]